jgi:uncharacterized protein (DUF362 family)
MSINRREFTKKMLAVASGIGLWNRGIAGRDGKESVVYAAKSGQLKRNNHDVNRALARRYINQALLHITGSASASAAWRKLFPSHQRVAIKLSCLPGKPLSSSRGVVMAIVDGLLAAGIKGNHIYVWERTARELQEAGFSVGRGRINILGTDNFPAGGYSQTVEISGSVGTCFSKIMDEVDALVSVPVLKDHDIAGVSIALKNFYGAIHNPNKFHDNHCDPYVADLCNHPLIRKKLRLTVCDASRIQIHNGPAYFPRYVLEYGGLLVSSDPVALDRVGWDIIETERRKMGLKSLSAESRAPKYINSAARLNLGCADLARIRLVPIGV